MSSLILFFEKSTRMGPSGVSNVMLQWKCIW